MSLDYELFLELHRKAYKVNSNVEADMVSSAKKKYDEDLKAKLDKKDLSNIEVFNYLDNFLIRENTIKFMDFCESEIASTYSKNFFKLFLKNFKKINNSNNVYLREINKELDTNIKLNEFKDTDFLRISEVMFRSLHDTFLKKYISGKLTKVSTLKFSVKKALKEELLLTKFFNINEALIRKKIEDTKFSSYEHFKTTLMFTFNKLELNDYDIGISDDDLLKASSELLNKYLNMCSDLFEKELRIQNNKKVHFVGFSDTYEKKVSRLLDKFGETFMNYKPLLQTPKDWKSIDDGGYYTTQVDFIKSRNKKHLDYIKDNFDLQQEFDTCNSLQKTSFRVNKEVHEVMYNLFYHNKENKVILKNKVLPTAVINTDLVYRDSILDAEYDSLNKKDQVRYLAAKQQFKEETASLFTFKASTKAKRDLMSTILKLSAEFYDHKFYYVYTVDSRGRKYPASKFLNPQGNDYAKGVLQLGEGQKLTEESIQEYKLHIANIFAIDKIDKACDEDKIKWVDDNSEMFLAVARDPYKNSVWQNADKPWQALATCFEWQKIKKFGTNYVSHAYMDIDGSNNGLQHYSAMLKDTDTAILTNIADNEKCEDAYQFIADKCNEYIDKNYWRFSEAEQTMINKLRLYGINRKLLKQPVMTTPYSATIEGWKNQMMKVINEMINNGEENHFDNRSDMVKSCGFLAEHVLYKVAEENLPAPFSAMKVMKKHIEIIHNLNNEAEFMFLNPVNFLVANNYKKITQAKINYRFLKRVRTLYFDKFTDKNNLRKLLQSFCPNVVHSIDAAHMTKVINRCKKEGINDFVMVHDSFGCHPNDMMLMKRIVKEEFAKMHEPNLLLNVIKDLYVFNDLEFDMEELERDCKRGDFDLQESVVARFGFK